MGQWKRLHDAETRHKSFWEDDASQEKVKRVVSARWIFSENDELPSGEFIEESIEDLIASF